MPTNHHAERVVPRLSRRGFVTAGAGVGGVLALTAAGCTVAAPPPEPDALLPLAQEAERDAVRLAAADASHGADVDRLRRVAAVRRVHAERLRTEIDRLTPPVTTSSSPATPVPPVCPPIEQVRTGLRESARRAGEFAGSSHGYRAELAAAVSAACTACAEVVLA